MTGEEGGWAGELCVWTLGGGVACWLFGLCLPTTVSLLWLSQLSGHDCGLLSLVCEKAAPTVTSSLLMSRADSLCIHCVFNSGNLYVSIFMSLSARLPNHLSWGRRVSKESVVRKLF